MTLSRFATIMTGIGPEFSKVEEMKVKYLTLAAVIICALLISACDSTDWESAGYQDGYAATVNTACEFRATLVHGDYDNADYAKGYSQGANAGSLAVAQQGCHNLR